MSLKTRTGASMNPQFLEGLDGNLVMRDMAFHAWWLHINREDPKKSQNATDVKIGNNLNPIKSFSKLESLENVKAPPEEQSNRADQRFWPTKNN